MPDQTWCNVRLAALAAILMIVLAIAHSVYAAQKSVSEAEHNDLLRRVAILEQIQEEHSKQIYTNTEKLGELEQWRKKAEDNDVAMMAGHALLIERMTKVETILFTNQTLLIGCGIGLLTLLVRMFVEVMVGRKLKAVETFGAQRGDGSGG